MQQVGTLEGYRTGNLQLAFGHAQGGPHMQKLQEAEAEALSTDWR